MGWYWFSSLSSPLGIRGLTGLSSPEGRGGEGRGGGRSQLGDLLRHLRQCLGSLPGQRDILEMSGLDSPGAGEVLSGVILGSGSTRTG
jgi:hypothetical protein